jgi:tripartite-type tricarboxylate transporter receptor subunit TctC
VRIVVGFPAGITPDIVARLLAQSLSERLGQQFIVDNRPGAASNIATEAVVRAPADGYTLLVVTSTNAINATLYDRLNFDFIGDIAPVAGIIRSPNLLQVNPSVPAKTLPEFIAYAKANPGKLNYASSGNGSATHVAGELFKAMAGVDLVHVPYRGSYLPDLIGGQVQVAFGPIAQSLEFIKAGKLRALAVTSATRSDALPDVPTVAEFVPGYEANVYDGIGAPKNTPPDIIGKLSKEINAVLAEPNMKARLVGLGTEPMPMTPAEFGKFIADETEKWGKVIRFARIKAD